jgi:hypothetical protein
MQPLGNFIPDLPVLPSDAVSASGGGRRATVRRGAIDNASGREEARDGPVHITASPARN